MDTKRYENFLKVVETGSLTKAAEALGCTQSGVSHALSSLEEELGFALLRRSKAGAKLTAEGERVLPPVRALLNAAEQLSQTAAGLRGLESGTVRIGTFTSVAVHWLPGIIKAFQKNYPGVEFRIMSGDYHDVEQWLEEGSVDLSFVTLPCGVPCRCIPLADDRIMAVVPKDHRFADLPRFPLAKAGDEPFISLLEASDQDLRRALEAAGVAPNIALQTKDDYAIIAMVENGLGISIMPELLLKGRTDNVKVMELAPPASRTIALAVPRGGEPGPATAKFIDCAVSWVRRHKT
jgi:DNA-binding transcriptional LysR family regulator